MVGFFQRLLGTEDDNVTCCPLPILIELFATTIPDEAHAELSRLVTPEEIKRTIFVIGVKRHLG